MIHGIFCNKFYESINFSASNLKNHDLDLVQWMEAQIWNGGSIKVAKRQEEVNCLVEVVAKVTAECCQDSLLDTIATFPTIAGVLPGILEFQGRAELTKKHLISAFFFQIFLWWRTWFDQHNFITMLEVNLHKLPPGQRSSLLWFDQQKWQFGK